MEIDGDNGGIVLFEETCDDFGELGFFRSAGELFDGAVFVVGDAEAIEKIAEEFAVGANKPDLEELSGDAFVLCPTGGVLQPGEAFVLWLSFDEDRAEFPLGRKGVDGGFEQSFFVFADPGEDLGGNRGGHLREKLVGFIHTEKSGGEYGRRRSVQSEYASGAGDV